MNRVDSARRSGSRPPCTIPNSAFCAGGPPASAPPSGACGPWRRRRPARRRRHDRLVEGDRDVRAERLLDRDRVLRGEAVGRAIDVAAERHAVLVDDPQIAERHDLVSARVGQDRPVPGHEAVQPAKPLDALVAGAQVQVVRVGEDDRGAGRRDLVGIERLDRRVRADRHELRRLDDAVRQFQPPGPGARRSVRGCGTRP